MAKGKKKQSGEKIKLRRVTSEGLPLAHRRNSFKSFKDLADYSKSLVYSISRLRPTPDGRATQTRTVGTGFLVGKNRLMTCAHCINDPSRPSDEMGQHKDGDTYLLVQRDEFGSHHQVLQAPLLNQQLFVHPEQDTAVLYLDDNFYSKDGQSYFKHPDLYLELDSRAHGIGTEMGILGYPFSTLQFDQNNGFDTSDMVVRGDRGVINTRKKDGNLELYESTTGFNPGNSGGPIFNINTGTVIGMVKGYTAIPMHWMKDIMQVGEYEGNADETTHHHRLRCLYSFGVASTALLALATQHQLATR